MRRLPARAGVARRRLVLLVLAAAAAAASSTAAAAPSADLPRLRSYAAPAGLALAGEPSIGVNPRTGAVLYQGAMATLRVDAFDAAGRGTARWQDVTPHLVVEQGITSASLDPILETDPRTGRTWVSHLLLACSRMAFTDDDGRTWTPVPAGCSPGAVHDHQTVGAGPFPSGTPGVTHPSAVYYCANSVVVTACGVSRDGGRTFGPARPVGGNGEVCTIGWGLHVARDGTAYLPPYACGGRAGVYVTEDVGTTWSARPVPGSTIGNAVSPGVATDAAGTLYLVWGSGGGAGGGGPPAVAVSRDKGRTWSAPYDLGDAFGLANTKHTVAVAGDAGRAAVAFLGATEPGDDQNNGYRGVWRLYVSFTYDGGRTWRTVNATPESPVQVGAICMAGTACDGSRNLLDFNDIAIDASGRVLVAITDGCSKPACDASDRERRPVIVRQYAGARLRR